MKKYYLSVLLFGICLNSHAHEFLTEILLESESFTVTPDTSYGVIGSFELTEDDIWREFYKDQIRFEVKRLITHRESNHSAQPRIRDLPSRAYIEEEENDDFPPTCGVFDHFHISRKVAISRCNAVANIYGDIYLEGLIPQFIGPASFTNGNSASENHHSAYNVSQGIKFKCVGVAFVVQ